MSEIAAEEFEKDMKEMTTRLKVLRAEYNQFLSGVMQAPPHFSEAQIRKIIRKYATTRGLKGVQRFQYFNLVAKFNTLMEFYNRRIKEKTGRETDYLRLCKNSSQNLKKKWCPPLPHLGNS